MAHPHRVAGELYESVTGQLFEIGRQLRQPNGYPFDAKRLKPALQDIIEGKFGPLSVIQGFPVRVNYNLPIKCAIAAGTYDHIFDGDLFTQENFPSNQRGEDPDMQIIPIRFGMGMYDLWGETADGVFQEFDRRGLRAATLPELLAFGKTYPNVQLDFPIVALGSILQLSGKPRRAACLGEFMLKRYLGFESVDEKWSPHFSSMARFAAVQERSKLTD